ncbi:hypothetical protein ACH4JZ_18310 [Streptomyces sp. NPDC017615]|uniref:hypothetical protein n=1 Tax=Streptomyces sp. NPDC017615 TaxID=3365003 RepID=UPI0037AC73BC
MAFPDSALGLRGELLLGDRWQNITGDLYTRDPIKHTRGRPYRSSSADPSALAATIRNIDGRYTPRNAEGPYYGLLGRATPFRLTLPGGPTRYLTMSGATDRATTPDVAALDITGDLDLRWDGEADWYANGAQILLGKWGTVGNRSYHLRLQDGALYIHATLDGSSGRISGRSLPAQLPRRAALRATLDVDNGAGGTTARMYWAPTMAGPWTQMGADVVDTPTVSVYAGTAPLSIAPEQLDLADPVRHPVVGRTYKAEVRNGIDGPLVASPDFTAQPQGYGGTFTDSAGRVWTVAADAEVTDRVIRFEGEVPEWPPKWTPSKADAWTPITAAGLLRRLSQGQKPLASTMRRRIPSSRPRPLAYWPMEDGPAATQASSGLANGLPMRVTGLNFAGDEGPPGSSPLPTVGQGGSIIGQVAGAKAGGWHVELVYRLTTLPTTEQTMFAVVLKPGTGGVAQVLVRVSTAGIRVQGLDGDGKIVAHFLYQDANAIKAFTSGWQRLRIFSVVNGGLTNLVAGWVDVLAGSYWLSYTSYTGTPGAVTGVRASWGQDLQGMSLGHVAVFDTGGSFNPITAGVSVYNSSDDGFLGELAGARMRRLCTEEDIPLRIVGNIADTAPVGSQRPAPLLDLLRECAAADGGIFGETSDRRSLVYRTRTDLYNQAPKLVLDYATGQIASPFEPVEDDQVRNSWEVQRAGGASGTATLDTGPLSTGDIGLYEDSTTLNLASDDQPTPTANWLLHLSTWDEPRYPSVTVLLHKTPELIPAVMALGEGDKIQIVNLPREFTGSGTAELLVDGWAEEFLPRTWTVTFNCAPAGPWNVAASAITEDWEDTNYVIGLANGGNAPWSRSQAHYNTGTWSLKSGTITNNQTSDLVVTVPVGATTLAFSYYTSSESSGPGFEGDRLLVLVDGVQVLRAQGATPWTRTTVDVTKAATVTFRYVKDNSSSVGEDAAWIDDLTFVLVAPARVDTDGSELAAGASATATALTVRTTAGPVWITSDDYPAEFPLGLQLGGETVRANAIRDAVRDAFGRTASASWGTTDTGQVWTLTGTADFSVSGGYGVVAMPTVSVSRVALVPAPTADVDLLTDIATSALAVGASLVAGPIIRAADNNNWYGVRVEFTTAAAIQISIRKRLAGTETTLSSVYTYPVKHQAGTFYRVRTQAAGTSLAAKVWAVGTPEPDAWQITATDASLSAAANVGIRCFASTGSTVVSPQLRVDNFRITNPQTLTVNRSRNAVVKAQTVGTPVRVARPAPLAL